MMGLTPEMRVLMIYLQTRESSPTYTEMQKATGRARSSLYVSLKCLEERGYIARSRRRDGRARDRSITVLRKVEPRYRFLTLEQAKAEAAERRAS